MNPLFCNHTFHKKTNIQELEEPIYDLYRYAGLPKPQIALFESIFAAEFVLALKYKLYPNLFWRNKHDPFYFNRCGKISPSGFWEHLEAPIHELRNWLDDHETYPKTPVFVEQINDNDDYNLVPKDKVFFPDIFHTLLHLSQGRYSLPNPLKLRFHFQAEMFQDNLNTISNCCFCCYYFEDCVFIIKPPVEARLNADNHLHCDNGPSTIWADGIQTWHLNGVLVPYWAIETKGEYITLSDVLAPDGAYGLVKLAILEKIGEDRFFHFFNADRIDFESGYELFEAKIYSSPTVQIDIFEEERMETYQFLKKYDSSKSNYNVKLVPGSTGVFRNVQDVLRYEKGEHLV